MEIEHRESQLYNYHFNNQNQIAKMETTTRSHAERVQLAIAEKNLLSSKSEMETVNREIENYKEAFDMVRLMFPDIKHCWSNIINLSKRPALYLLAEKLNKQVRPPESIDDSYWFKYELRDKSDNYMRLYFQSK